MSGALPSRLAWLEGALDDYIAEEAGHDEWILNDIRAAGGAAEAVRHGAPGHATEVMVEMCIRDRACVWPAARSGA